MKNRNRLCCYCSASCGCCCSRVADPAAAVGEFTIIVLPDTQNYSTSYPEIFTSQTQWIANNKTALDIAFVAHVGDVVNTSTSGTEYTRADTSMDLLDAGAVAYGMCPGNHDMGGGSLYSTYFGTSRFSGKPTSRQTAATITGTTISCSVPAAWISLSSFFNTRRLPRY